MNLLVTKHERPRFNTVIESNPTIEEAHGVWEVNMMNGHRC